MNRGTIALLLSVFLVTNSFAETGSQSVRRHFGIDEKIKLDRETIKHAVLTIVPLGSTVEEVVKALAKRGMAHPAWPAYPAPDHVCMPGDDTPVYCDFRTPKQDKKRSKEPNWTVDFTFDQNNKLRDIVVQSWTYD